VLRQRLRGSAAERVKILEEIADGLATEDIEIPLALALHYVACPTCGDRLESAARGSSELVRIKERASARAADRKGAVDVLLKYGLGEKLEVESVSREDVAQRLTETYAVLKRELTRSDYVRVVRLIAPTWEGESTRAERSQAPESVA
jgi:hypothetical protein